MFKKIILVVILLLLNSCVFTNEPNTTVTSGPCTETGNPTGISGKIINPSPQNTKQVKITLYEVKGNDTSGIATALTQTASCQDGTFGFLPKSNSTYAIEAIDTVSQLSAREPAFVWAQNQSLKIPSLTLALTGSISGDVSRDSNPLPSGILKQEKILVRIIHTDRYFTTDTSGKYDFHSLSAGKYRIAYSATDGHYLNAYSDTILLEPGNAITLPRVQLKWSPFVASPTPTGLIMQKINDSIISLKWLAAKIDTPFHYEIERTDSLASKMKDTLFSSTHSYIDTLKGVHFNHTVTYKLRLINRLLNASPWSQSDTVSIPVFKPLPTEKISLHAFINAAGVNSNSIKVFVYKNPDFIGSPDSTPVASQVIDSTTITQSGLVHFQHLPMGNYSIEAISNSANPLSSAKKALRQNVKVYPDTTTLSSNPLLATPELPKDTLTLSNTGALRGLATRQKAWVSKYDKGNENISASLSGTLYKGITDFAFTPLDSEFVISGIAPGTYQLVIYATPTGFFLPDTQTITINANDTTHAKTTYVKYNPHAAMLKPHGLAILNYVNKNLTLSWNGVLEIQIRSGYLVTRIERPSGKIFISPTLVDTSYTDDLTNVASGTQLEYLVQTVTKDGQTSLHGGDNNGTPALFTVP